jgi:hypothetical protein
MGKKEKQTGVIWVLYGRRKRGPYITRPDESFVFDPSGHVTS